MPVPGRQIPRPAPEWAGSPGAVDTLNIDASGDAALAGAASIGINPAFTYTWFASSDSGAATELLNFAPAAIRYRHTFSSATTPDAAYNNRIEFVNVLGSTGNDNITGSGGNDTISVLKGTSLASVIAVNELTLRSEQLVAANFRFFTVFAASGIIYLVITSVIALDSTIQSLGAARSSSSEGIRRSGGAP